MHPYLFTIGDWSIPAYPTLYGCGIALASVVVLALGTREALDIRRLAHLLLLASLSIVLGGRIFYVFQYSEQFAADYSRAFDLSAGGQVFYGGLLLTIPTVILSGKLLRLPLGHTADLLAIGAPLGLAIGRLACFCRGCCYGKVTDVSWAIRYPKHVDVEGNVLGAPALLSQIDQGLLTEAAAFSLPVHPAPIYASLVSLAVFFLMLWIRKVRRFQNKLIIVYPVVYAATRFGLAFTREYKLAFGGLTVSQVVSLAVLVVGVSTLVVLHRVKPTANGTGLRRFASR